MAYFLKLIFPLFYKTVEFILQSDIIDYTSHTISKANGLDRFYSPNDTSPLSTLHLGTCDKNNVTVSFVET